MTPFEDSSADTLPKFRCYDVELFYRKDFVQTIPEMKLVRSKPTRCVKCGIINEMTHPQGADPKTGSWTCSRCGHLYRFAHWKIQKAGKASEIV
jgi:hypothetical protein